MSHRLLRLLGCVLLLLSNSVYAKALTIEQVPEPLKPWVGWVLDEYPDYPCPYLYNAEQRQCAWPGRLELALNDQGGTFTQHWQVYGETRVRLPGDAQHWPQQVRLGTDTALAVMEENGYPVTTLPSGSHSLSGQFVWDKLPEALFVAPDTGLVQLRVNGMPIPTPAFNKAGSLWLSSNQQATSEDNLEIQVFRKVHDSHPLTVTTSIQLRVAGKQRHVELAPVLLEGFIPLQLTSPLPTRMGQDGRLQVQLRPGEWTLTLTGRALGNVQQLALPASTAPWPSEEVWVFEADPSIRQVQIEGVNSIDPSQTRLPDAWRHLPAYLLTAGSTMQLMEQHRGIPNRPAQIRLQRQLWLDFDGKGYTLHDQLSGTLSQQSRLEVSPEIRLGRVSLGDELQLITRSPESQADGIEVRQQALNLEADSRYEAGSATLPVSGWQQELQQVRTTLHLPPGWLLVATQGTDNLPDTWLQQWDLLDLFLVLLIIVATGYLYGWRWSVVAGIALVLTWHLNEAPHLIWLNLLAVVALLRALPAGAMRVWLERYRWASLLALLLILLPFTLSTVRTAIYPQLAANESVSDHVDLTDNPEAVPEAVPNEPVAEAEQPVGLTPQQLERRAATVKSAVTSPSNNHGSADLSHLKSGIEAKREANLRHIDPNSMIQTGPGLPRWQGNTLMLEWSGVITPDERVHLWLLPPWAYTLLKLIGVIMLFLLAFCLTVTVKPDKSWWQRLRHPLTWWQVSVSVLLGFTLWLGQPSTALAAEPELPSPALLKTLQERLLRAPDCVPRCAQIDAMDMHLQANALQVRLRVHAAETVALPLPGGSSTWMPHTVLLNGAETTALRRDEEQRLWVVIPQGQHDVVLQGELPSRSNLALPLPLKPHRVTWQGEGWQVDGVRDNGVPDDPLQLNRITSLDNAATQDSSTLPAFVKIQRRLDLGLDWYVVTTVSRVSDSAVPIHLAIPLLPGEQPLSEQFALKDNTLQVSLNPQQDKLQWTSRLPPSSTLTLTASNHSSWLEEWQVAASPMWHVEASGLPVNVYPEDSEQHVLLWKPWAGETLQLIVNRPQGTAGQTLTILASEVTVEVGKRARDVSLRLHVQSSRGAQHPLTLPENAVLKSLMIDGTKQAIQQQQGKVMLPLSPGKQEIVLEWQETGAIPWLYRFPTLDLGLPSVNSEFRLMMPQDRWILWTHGPLLGPAVLFWGTLAVLLGLAILLGRSGLTPLKTWQWFLLGVGLSQSSPYLMILLAIWLIALAMRSRYNKVLPYWKFNLMQLVLVCLTLVALAVLIGAVANGLLGLPDMQIAGNGSWAYQLMWYQDRSASVLAQPMVVSVPLLFYRLLMLAWALWLAVALLSWLRWGWQALSYQRLWQAAPARKSSATPITPAAEEASHAER